MTQNEKPFWIDEKAEIFFSLNECRPKHGAFIEVIEHSAYLAIQQELEEARAALEVYAMTNETFPEYGNVAREFLKKYPKGEK